MNNTVNFNSVYYKKIHFKNILKSAFVNETDDHKIFGLINAMGFAMIPETVFTTEDILLFSEIGRIKLPIINLTNKKNLLFSDLSVSFFNVGHNCKIYPVILSDSYNKIIKGVIHAIYKAIESIFIYTYSHLEKRQYNHQSITQIEAVQFEFSDIFILVERMRHFISPDLNMEDSVFAMTVFIDILDKLSKLGGARSVIKGNAIELMFYIKLFQKFIIMEL